LDWERYKLICDTPNVFSRWMLEQTRELAGTELGAVLEQALAGEPVPKPPDHRGGVFTDMFELQLSLADVREIVAVVATADESGRTSSATRERGIGGFHAAWQEYADHLGSLEALRP
jgi:hypothetical protein